MLAFGAKHLGELVSDRTCRLYGLVVLLSMGSLTQRTSRLLCEMVLSYSENPKINSDSMNNTDDPSVYRNLRPRCCQAPLPRVPAHVSDDHSA